MEGVVCKRPKVNLNQRIILICIFYIRLKSGLHNFKVNITWQPHEEVLWIFSASNIIDATCVDFCDYEWSSVLLIRPVQ